MEAYVIIILVVIVLVSSSVGAFIIISNQAAQDKLKAEAAEAAEAAEKRAREAEAKQAKRQAQLDEELKQAKLQLEKENAVKQAEADAALKKAKEALEKENAAKQAEAEALKAKAKQEADELLKKAKEAEDAAKKNAEDMIKQVKLKVEFEDKNRQEEAIKKAQIDMDMMKKQIDMDIMTKQMDMIRRRDNLIQAVPMEKVWEKRPWNNCVPWAETSATKHDDWCTNDVGPGWKHIGQDGAGCTKGFGKGVCGREVERPVGLIGKEIAVNVGSKGATFYEHCDYQGQSWTLGPGEYPNLGKFGIANDSISSIRSPPGLRVTLYEHDNFQGRAAAIVGDIPCLTNINFNDAASSIKVEIDDMGSKAIARLGGEAISVMKIAEAVRPRERRPWNNCVVWGETSAGKHDDWCMNDLGPGWKHVGQEGAGCAKGWGKGICESGY